MDRSVTIIEVLVDHCGVPRSALAKALSMTASEFNLKLRGIIPFSKEESDSLSKILLIPTYKFLESYANQ